MTTLDIPPARTIDRSARSTAAWSLVTAGLLGVVAGLSAYPAGSTPGSRLDAIDAAGPKAIVFVLALTLMQPFLLIGLIGLGAVLRVHARRLTAIGIGFAVAGAFGEAVNGGQQLVLIAMAPDQAHRSTYAGILAQLNQPPAALFSLLGLAGSVLGVLLLSIAVFRTRTGPRWVAPALWAFLVLEYIGSTVVLALGYIAVLAALAAFIALARELRRR